jgi:multiple sugar transport system substrate-binding protein
MNTYALLATAIAPLIALSACSGTSGDASNTPGTTTITLVSDGAPSNAKATNAVIALFEKSHPTIKVKFEPDTSTARQGSVLRIGQGDPSLDIASAEVGYQYQWYANGWISPVTKYFTKDELATVVPHLVSEWTDSKGQMLGIPTDNSGMWLAVNQDLLKQAGVTPPPTMKRDSLSATTGGVWTWEQVLAAAKQVEAKAGKVGLLFTSDQAWPTLPLAEQVGAKPTSPDGLTVKGYLDQQPWVDAMTRWKAFFADGASQITNPEWTNSQFLAGDAAFQLSHIAVSDECAQATFDCDAAAEPYYQGGKPVVQSVNSGWVLNSKSPHQAEAAEFMKFVLLNPDASKALVNGPFFAGIPMLRAPLDAMQSDPAFQKFPASVKVLGAWQSENWPEEPVKSPVGGTLFTSITDAYKASRTGALTPQEAVAKMTDQVDRALAKVKG